MNTASSISDKIKPKLIKYISKNYRTDGYYIDSVSDARYFDLKSKKETTHNEIIREIRAKTGYCELDILFLLEKWILNEGKIKK